MKKPFMNRTVGALLALALASSVCAARRVDASDTASFQLQRTDYGVAHVRSTNFAGLGAGTGYAYAQDNLCLLMELALTARGERSKYFGAEALVPGIPQLSNLEQDVFVRAYLDKDALAAQYAQVAPEIRSLLRGYVAGVNDYLRRTAAQNRDPRCAGKTWVQALTLEDVYLMTARVAHIQMLSRFAKFSVAAQAPQTNAAAQAWPSLLQAAAEGQDDSPTGSNGYAFGQQVTHDRRGLVLANPHLSWVGASRFYQLHWTIPGRIDVMGVALAGLPMIVIGFNRDVAWMNPTTSSARFTLHELTLKEGDPSVYLVDGKPHRLQSKEVTVEYLAADGSTQQMRRTVWRSHHGPLWTNPALGAAWTSSKAYALRDANEGNVRLYEHWLRLGMARSIDDFVSAHREVNGMAWSSTVAADRNGQVLFSESSATPNLSQERIQGCRALPVAAALEKTGMILLDGARSDCDWEVEAGTRQPGLMPPSRLPLVRRDDFVQNSNDSAWMSHPDAPLPATTPVLGPWHKPLRLRTRLGIAQVHEQLGEPGRERRGRLDAEFLKSLLFANRNHAAELALPSLKRLCRDPAILGPEAQAACDVLTQWDGRSDSESRGASLFREFWRRASMTAPATLWSTPFDPRYPATTPRDLNVGTEAGRQAIVAALEQAVQLHRKNELALDARLADLQFVVDAKGRRIGLHGGEEFEGVYNKMGMSPLGAGGYGEVTPAGNTGATYIQVVHWDDTGPVADAMLVYGQSADQRSPHYLDQARELYAKKQWNRLPFNEADVGRRAIASPLGLKVRLPAE
jgi:acyl-homoserine-lactone acylase